MEVRLSVSIDENFTNKPIQISICRFSNHKEAPPCNYEQTPVYHMVSVKHNLALHIYIAIRR